MVYIIKYCSHHCDIIKLCPIQTYVLSSFAPEKYDALSFFLHEYNKKAHNEEPLKINISSYMKYDCRGRFSD